MYPLYICITLQVNSQAGDHHHQMLRRRKTSRNNLGGDVICINAELPNIIYIYIYTYCFPNPWISVATVILGRLEKQHEMEHQLSHCVQTLAPPFPVESPEKQPEAEKEQLRQDITMIRVWYAFDTPESLYTSCKSDARVMKHIGTPSRELQGTIVKSFKLVIGSKFVPSAQCIYGESKECTCDSSSLAQTDDEVK